MVGFLPEVMLEIGRGAALLQSWGSGGKSARGEKLQYESRDSDVLLEAHRQSLVIYLLKVPF